MKVLLLALFVCAVNGASFGGLFGGFGAGLSNLADDIAGTGVSGGRNRISNPIETAARIITAPAVAAHAVATSAAAIADSGSVYSTRTSSTAAPEEIIITPAQVITAPAAFVIAPNAASEAVVRASANAVISSNDFGPSVTADVAPAVSKSASTDSQSEILQYDAEVRSDGYFYRYETSNGIAAESIGELKNVNDSKVIVMKGYYRYTDDEGKPVLLTYVADENGFQPESDILPVAPPVPDIIARAIAYILSQIKSGQQTEEGN